MMAWARKKRPRQEPGELAQEQIPTPARTKVNDLGSKLLVGGVYGAIALGLLSGCGALGMSVMSSGAETAPVVETMNTATAEGTAVSYVTAWLTASRQDQSLLSAYVKEDSRKVPETPLAVRDVAVAGVEKTEDPDVISVLVAAHVEQRTELEQDGQTPKNTTSSAPASASTEAKTSAKPAPTTYALRYYQVAVKQTEGTVQVIGYPTPARGPRQGEAVSLGYPHRISTTTDLGNTLEGFLQSYGAGKGDVTRYLAATDTLEAITPAPYTELVIEDLRTSKKLEELPDGEAVRVLIQAEGVLPDASQSRMGATFPVTVARRDGRWEVISLDPAPLLAPESESRSATPTS